MPNSPNLSSYRSVGFSGYPASLRWQTLCFVTLQWNLGSFRQPANRTGRLRPKWLRFAEFANGTRPPRPKWLRSVKPANTTVRLVQNWVRFANLK